MSTIKLKTNSEDATVKNDVVTEVARSKKDDNFVDGEKVSSLKSVEITSFIRSKLGPFKFKDVNGKRGYEITDTKGTPFVVQRIALSKVSGENNKIEVVLIMPNPEEIEIVKASGRKGS